MRVEIDYLERGQWVGGEYLNASLDEAKDIAVRALEGRVADQVEIRDQLGRVMFKRPRTVRRAQGRTSGQASRQRR